MDLTKTIEALKKKLASQVSRETNAKMDTAARNLEASGIVALTLKPGDKAPSFTLPDVSGVKYSSDKFIEKGPLVISFFRGTWCLFCNLELKALQDSYKDIIASGASLVAITPQHLEKAAELIKKRTLPYKLLSDKGNRVARQFGLVYPLAEELRPVYLNEFNVNLPEHNADGSWDLPLPATYIIDQFGSVAYAFVNADYTRRLEPKTIVRVLKSLKGYEVPVG